MSISVWHLLADMKQSLAEVGFEVDPVQTYRQGLHLMLQGRQTATHGKFESTAGSDR